MFSSENLLGLPREKFGSVGIGIGNIISKKLAKQDKGYKAQYNPLSNRIVILNTSDVAPTVLDKILYVSSASCEYHKWRFYPIIKKERTKEGDLEIDFSGLKPGVDHSKGCFSRMYSTFLPDPDYDGPILAIDEPPKFLSIDCKEKVVDEVIDKEEFAIMEKAISDGIINTMSQFLNKHKITKGIWYPNDYRKYLMDEFDIEMDESFYTGFANKKFFEKTGCFTFKLKEGKKASEALLSFLEGPTVADCGNATMACYYKCVLDIVGNDKFDKLFSSKPFTLTISRHGITDAQSPISYLSEYTTASKKQTTGIPGKRPLEIGQECHFGGVGWYANKHPAGVGAGWNVIYIGNNQEGQQLFMAHGFEQPLTENQIYQKLVEIYNRKRTPQDEQLIIQARQPHLYDKKRNKHLVSHYTISKKEIEQNLEKFVKGFLVGSIRGLQVDRLIKLIKTKNINQFKLNLTTKKISSFQSLLF